MAEDFTLPTEDPVYALVDGDGELYAVPYAAVTPSYGVGTSNLELFRGVVQKLPYGDHYVYYRESQFDYVLAHSPNLEFVGGSFQSPDIIYVRYNTYYTSGGQPTYRITSGSNFSLSPSSYLVYSDLGDYPSLVGKDVYYAEALCVGLGVLTLLYFLGRIRSSLRL